MDNKYNQHNINSKETNLSRLRGALSTLKDTEKIADDTLLNLDIQKKQLKKSKENIKTTDGELSRSNSFINRMLQWWKG